MSCEIKKGGLSMALLVTPRRREGDTSNTQATHNVSSWEQAGCLHFIHRKQGGNWLFFFPRESKADADPNGRK